MYLLTHDELITLDLYIETEFNHNDTILSPVTELDFDVNALFYYAHGKQYYLGLWQDELDITVEQLVERLQSKDRTAQMQPSCSIPRMAKMIDKGWKVV